MVLLHLGGNIDFENDFFDNLLLSVLCFSSIMISTLQRIIFTKVASSLGAIAKSTPTSPMSGPR